MIDEQQPIDDGLIGKYLAGEASPEEAERVRRWLGESPDEQSEFARFEQIWDESGKLKQPVAVDTDAAWKKVRRQMQDSARAETDSEINVPTSIATTDVGAMDVVRPLYPADPERSLGQRQRTLWQGGQIWRVAAAVVLLIGLGWVAYQSLLPEPVAMQTIATQQSKTTITLPDGSQVVLNRNSRLNYPDRFTDSLRQVTLTGEAFFDIKPDAEHPFVIKARETTVRVLGTSFSIRAYSDTVRVAVATGRVQFGTIRKRIFLTRNEEASYDISRDTLRKAFRLTPNAMAFRTNRLIFDRTTLAEVARTLTDVYGTPVRLSNESLRNCQYNATFENEKLETVLNLVAETLKLHVERTSEGFVLAGNGCQ